MEKPVEVPPTEAVEPEKPTEVPPTEPVEPEKPTEVPTTESVTVRKVAARKPRKASAPSVALPEIDNKFWANLLRTQREAERATRLQRMSEFNLL